MQAISSKVQRSGVVARPSRQPLAVKLSASPSGQINPSIRKEEPKVADIMKVADLPTPKAVMCRCWRSSKFPYCDGAHMQHNKDTGDNVGPLVIETK